MKETQLLNSYKFYINNIYMYRIKFCVCYDYAIYFIIDYEYKLKQNWTLLICRGCYRVAVH